MGDLTRYIENVDKKGKILKFTKKLKKNCFSKIRSCIDPHL